MGGLPGGSKGDESLEVTLETIYQQQLELKQQQSELKQQQSELRTELKAEVGRLDSKVDSVKTWFITLSLSTILVVTAIITAVVTAQLH